MLFSRERERDPVLANKPQPHLVTDEYELDEYGREILPDMVGTEVRVYGPNQPASNVVLKDVTSEQPWNRMNTNTEMER